MNSRLNLGGISRNLAQIDVGFWELVQSMKVGYFEKLGLLFQMDILLSVCGETTVGFF